MMQVRGLFIMNDVDNPKLLNGSRRNNWKSSQKL
jgi:hypothetical protein